MAETKKTETKILKIQEKLANISELLDVMKKDTKAFNFSYVDEESILERLTVGLKQQKLELYPIIVPGTSKITEQLYDKKKYNKNGDPIVETIHETVVSAEMIMRWINLEDLSETLDIPWLMVGGQTDPSQALGSGLSYCIRYFYLKFFHIATTKDDPDSFRSKQDEIEAGQVKNALSIAMDKLDKVARDYGKENVAELKAFLIDNNNGTLNYKSLKDIDEVNALKDKLEKFIEEQKEVK
jgi:hypothetical protein